MAYKIVVKQQARDDADEAYNHYEDQKIGLGDDFLDEVEKKYKKIQEKPHNYGYIDDQAILRDVKVDRFPYVIVFEIVDDTVFVYSVHNTNRHPKRRLRKV
jgi:hypothetical protein